MKTLVLKTKLKIKPVYFTAAVETFKRLTAEREEFRWDERKRDRRGVTKSPKQQIS
ncbi:hypothetical protein AT3G26147 [Arabidopsis thaliana]|uniref:Uncharacterized protein n=1 Tax=Arabidopsis thaliana TaxID=3702 RepID=B3H613_ARATH|nr:uncharacterized protein AT3G26147 [Arabidopsis thaliana]AEE77126.1 hypothetical protein AT3G26147 [Arabidopsis thaliana]|eukprot:NP_001118702.1 hypothetical protein AT3G26147 [Arabidopsis thaliana]